MIVAWTTFGICVATFSIYQILMIKIARNQAKDPQFNMGDTYGEWMVVGCDTQTNFKQGSLDYGHYMYVKLEPKDQVLKKNLSSYD